MSLMAEGAAKCEYLPDLLPLDTAKITASTMSASTVLFHIEWEFPYRYAHIGLLTTLLVISKRLFSLWTAWSHDCVFGETPFSRT